MATAVATADKRVRRRCKYRKRAEAEADEHNEGAEKAAYLRGQGVQVRVYICTSLFSSFLIAGIYIGSSVAQVFGVGTSSTFTGQVFHLASISS